MVYPALSGLLISGRGVRDHAKLVRDTIGWCSCPGTGRGIALFYHLHQHRTAPDLGMAQQRLFKALYGANTPVTVLLEMPQSRPPGGRSGAARRRIRALIPGKEGKRLIDRHIPSASIRTPPSPSWGAVGVGRKQRFDLYAHHRAAPDLGMAQQRRSQALYSSIPPAEVLLEMPQMRPPVERSGAARRRMRALIPGGADNGSTKLVSCRSK